MTREPAGKEAAVHRRPYELVVFLRAALRAVLVAAVAQAEFVLVSGVVRLAVQRRLGMQGLEDLRQVPIVIVLAFVARLMQRDPGILAEIHQSRWVGVCGKQRAIRWWSVFRHHNLYGVVEIAGGNRVLVDIEMDWAEDAVVRLVA